MKYYIVLGFVLIVAFGMLWLSFQTTEHNVMHNNKKEVAKEPRNEIIPPHKIVEEFLDNLEHEHAEVKPTHPDTHKHEEVPKHRQPTAPDGSVPARVYDYLEDDIFELQDGMTKKEVDAIWGKPDEFRNGHGDGTWTYGNYFESDSKLKGLYYYKLVKFYNGKVSWWTKKASINIKTHHREDTVKDHLDESSVVKEGMSKVELYKLWGLPYGIEVTCYNKKEIESRWLYDTDDSFSHWAKFKNNKLEDWGDR